MSILFECRDLRFSYYLDTVEMKALKGVDLSIADGEFLALSGPSGSGKSTLLNLLGLIEAPQVGELIFEGKNIAGLSETEKNKIRRFRLGFIFQSFYLFDVLSAFENVEYFLLKQGLQKSGRDARVEKCLRAVGLWEHRQKRPLQMSGGQRQRVAIARALAKQPSIIIADEPTASLDQQTARQILDILRDLNEKEKVTVVVSSHDPLVLSYVPKVLHLRDGEIQK